MRMLVLPRLRPGLLLGPRLLLRTGLRSGLLYWTGLRPGLLLRRTELLLWTSLGPGLLWTALWRGPGLLDWARLLLRAGRRLRTSLRSLLFRTSLLWLWTNLGPWLLGSRLLLWANLLLRTGRAGPCLRGRPRGLIWSSYPGTIFIGPVDCRLIGTRPCRVESVGSRLIGSWLIRPASAGPGFVRPGCGRAGSIGWPVPAWKRPRSGRAGCGRFIARRERPGSGNRRGPSVVYIGKLLPV